VRPAHLPTIRTSVSCMHRIRREKEDEAMHFPGGYSLLPDYLGLAVACWDAVTRKNHAQPVVVFTPRRRPRPTVEARAGGMNS